MSTRSQALVRGEGESIYLYQHCDGYNLPEEVSRAITRGKERWGDAEYLRRIIFNEMTQTDPTGTTGFGIGLGEHSDIEFLVVVDVDAQTVETFTGGLGKLEQPAYSQGRQTFEQVATGVASAISAE